MRRIFLPFLAVTLFAASFADMLRAEDDPWAPFAYVESEEFGDTPWPIASFIAWCPGEGVWEFAHESEEIRQWPSANLSVEFKFTGNAVATPEGGLSFAVEKGAPVFVEANQTGCVMFYRPVFEE